jgi:hypothetical protein
MNPQFQEELDKIAEGVFEEGALNGWVLGLINDIYHLPGEDHTDEQCLWLIHKLVNDWSKLAEEGKC